MISFSQLGTAKSALTITTKKYIRAAYRLYTNWCDLTLKGCFQIKGERGAICGLLPPLTCHRFIMTSCPSELLILLKRNACSPTFIISFHMLNKRVQTSPLTPWSYYHCKVLDDKMTLITWCSFKSPKTIMLHRKLFLINTIWVTCDRLTLSHKA